MKIYTKTGDKGETSLLGGTRVSKNDTRIGAYGTVDELNSAIGLARSFWHESPIDGELYAIQTDLFDIGSNLAAPEHQERFPGVSDERVVHLEHAMDRMEGELPPLKNFIVPGGSTAAAQLHVARTVCRRAERLVVSLGDEGEPMQRTIRYLNRLSDYLFVSARYVNMKMGFGDVPWKRE